MSMGILGGIAGGIVTGGIMNAGMSTLEPAMRAIKYGTEMQFQNMLPSPEMLFRSAFRTDEWGLHARNFFQFHGIPLFNANPGGAAKGTKKAWEAAVKGMQPLPDIMMLQYLARTGLAGNEELDKYIRMNLLNKELWELFDKASRGKLDYTAIRDIYLRGHKQVDWYRKETRRTFNLPREEARLLEEVLYQLPGPSDLISMAVKDVFNEKLANELKLFDEYDQNTEMLDIMKAAGLSKITIRNDKNELKEYDIPKLYWGAHWQLPSPTQAYMALHLLRPSNMARYKAIDNSITPFNIEDLKTLLKANDYSPRYRSMLAAISYNIPTLQDLKDAIAQEKITDDQIYERVLDRGYLPEDARMISDTYLAEAERTRLSFKIRRFDRKWKKLFSSLMTAYKDGSLSKAQVVLALQGKDCPDQYLNDNLTSIDIDINNKLIQQYIAMVKEEYMIGLYTPAQGLTALTDGGITQVRAGQLVALWERYKTKPKKIMTARTLIRYYVRGFIDRQEFNQRMFNMGWSNADTMLYLNEAEYLIEQQNARLAERQARDEKQRLNEIKRQIKEEEARRDKMLSEMKFKLGKTELRRYLKRGLMTEAEVRNVLFTYGYSPGEAQDFIDDVLGGKDGQG